jgi:hypothetical protein
MLVRALKVLDYFSKETTRTTPTRQPLISRAMKLALMADKGRIGNDEPRNVSSDVSLTPISGVGEFE